MKKEIIFCVDDEKMVLNSLKTELKNDFGGNYIIETAESGAESLEAIDNLLASGFEIPIVIVDYAMPNMKGDELLEKIHKKSPRTLKILLTGQATIEGVTNSINNAHLYRYIAKPWDTSDLILTINQALKSYHQEDQLKIQNKKLKELSTLLEKKVEMRTLELQNKNTLLLKNQKEITDQNEELEKYRNHLEELVEVRTKELTLSKEKAEESDRLKTAFLANISHEIRTPMNGILGFSDLLNNPNLSDEKQQKFVAVIRKSGERMLNTLNGLMDMSMLETGQVKLNLIETNINDELKSLYSFFKIEATEKRLLFNLSIPENSGELIIRTDREKLYGILSNLIKNAIKYSDVGSIDFGYIIKGDFMEFYVLDTGIGIPADRQIAVFDRFVQADLADANVFEGCGLGLSIAKSYVEMLKGEITLESIEGHGSKFYFTIPTNKIKKSSYKDVSIFEDLENDDFSKIKILIVEDEEISSVLLTLILEDSCSELLFAKNGLEAIDIYSKNPDIDLILMDVKMPIMGGFEATAKIREINKDVIIIAQTAYALVGDKEKAIEIGCNDYITKPIDEKILFSKIKKQFNKKIAQLEDE